MAWMGPVTASMVTLEPYVKPPLTQEEPVPWVHLGPANKIPARMEAPANWTDIVLASTITSETSVKHLTLPQLLRPPGFLGRSTVGGL